MPKKQLQSIIDMANATYAMPLNTHSTLTKHSLFASSSVVPSETNSMMSLDDRLDAARSLLGISPCSVADTSVAAPTFGGRAMAKPSTTTFSSFQMGGETTDSGSNNRVSVSSARPRSNSAGLEALAFLASQESAKATGTPVTHTLVQQPRLVPPPHLQKPSIQLNNVCITSSSDDDSEAMPPPPPRTITRRRSVSNPEGMEKYNTSFRLSLVLPASILEEELAEASAAMKAKEEEDAEEEEYEEDDNDKEEEEGLDQEELLRRARSRLLEDLSQGNLNGEKGVLTMPHSLAKYKEVYNKNGRIGIYTPAERAAIIARFQSKRSRRVWNKKIRYNCRKNLADRRLRVKGRFVKRSSLDAQLNEDQTAMITSNMKEKATTVTFAPETKGAEDDHMPDVNDPDAGFCPTDDQPFRRLRRHTIT
ncbi:CCT motif-containing protein [Nitzschia inconspicua]|uniref:CCT motif-containing protein n=1 Tax=Nitzschia inconspicua TaxID=303405 RepID=A0A9K3QA69_9STRA|nr:CCT motif-containing protein [Nitzschia inconspicua]